MTEQPSRTPSTRADLGKDPARVSGMFDEVAAGRLQGALLRALNDLDESKRAAFVLYEIEELTLREVAAVLDCPLQTAYSRLGAARDHVRRAFAQEGEP